MYRLLLLLVTPLYLVIYPLSGEDAPAKKEIPAEVNVAAIPSLVNLTSMPSAIVNGCVNVITGDLCESDEDDAIYSPDPYILGHSYCSSSLQEGNLGDGWNFLHHHLIEVFQPSRISYTKDPVQSLPCLLPIKAMGFIVEKGIGDRSGRDKSPPVMHDRPLHDIADRHHDGMNYRGHNRDEEGEKRAPEPLFLSLYDPSGGRLLYKTTFDEKHKERSLRNFKLESKLTGYTNVVAGRMSGQTNLKNIKMRWNKSSDAFQVTLGDGTERTYERQRTTKEMKKQGRNYTQNYRDYHLRKEIKPNGNIVFYDYNDKREIVDINAWNKNLSQKLYAVHFDQKTTGQFAKEPTLDVRTTDGLQHTYYFQKLDGSYMHGTWSVSHIRRQGRPYTNFVYCDKSKRHKKRIIKKETEGGFYISTKYYRPSDNWMNSRTVTPKNKKETKFLRNRVRMQLSPVGPNGSEVITHRYFYYKDANGGGHCTVRDAYNNISRHYWNKDKRLIRVTKNDSHDKRLMSEKYFWGKNDTEDEGRLLCRALYDEEYKPVLAHTFSYDNHGNILEEALYGRITENSGTLRMDGDKPHHESCDKQITRYSYTSDGFNLVKSMVDPLGNYTYYDYVPGTNLLRAKLVCDGKSIKAREFFDYDDNALVIKHTVDDGQSRDKNDLTGATQRQITRTKPRYTTPCFGEPEEVLEFFYNFDEKKEVYLNKTVNHFNEKGFVIKRELVDQLGGREFYEYGYDDIGRVIYTKDPLGQEEHVEYDKAGRVTKKRGPRKDVSWHYQYDVAGQLICEQEKHEKGPTLTTHYEYDLLGRKVCVTDAQNTSTHFEYDSLNRVTAVTYPTIYDHTGKAIAAKKTYTYKNLNTKVTELNENGLKTTTSYNALGKICSKKLPNDTKIRTEYDLKGNPVKEIAPNGAVNHIEYDGLGRIKQAKLMMLNEVICKKETIYSGFHPVLEIGPTGEKLAYSYDYAGRVASKEIQGKRITRYVYDEKGRTLRQRTFLENGRFENGGFVGSRYKYDALNRVIYESFRDHKERELTYKEYEYDTEGNKTANTQSIGNKKAISKATYHPHGLAKTQTDAEGNTTTHTYDYFYLNSYGQTVLCKRTIDALGATTEEIYDTRGNLSEITRYDPDQAVIAKKRLFYDAANSCIRSEEHALAGPDERAVITTLFDYKNNQLVAITEAAGTPEEKTTAYAYNEFGQKKSSTFSDGTILRYRYDAKGRVKRFFAADKSVDYRYQYDASDRILSVTNGVTGKATQRTYNRFGEIKSETLENGLTLTYRYDHAGRPTSLELPDGSKVRYDHSGFLEKITREDSQGNFQYSHSITERDKSGFVKACELANHNTITYSHDKLGRTKQTIHSQFEEKAKVFDAVGNLLKLHTTDATGKYKRDFSYDHLSQLIQEKGPTTHSYTYDSLHNRLSHNMDSYKVNGLHSVLSDSRRSFSYDARGNRTAMQEGATQTRYSYDALDRLVEVEKEDTRYIYVYDGFNRRVQKEAYTQGALGWIKEETINYLYAQDNEIGAADDALNIYELRILGEGLGAEIGAAVALELDGTTYVPLHDRQGNVVALLDFEGKVVEHYRYDAFGNETTQGVPINPWRFSSKRVDPETGMSNFGRRYYDPTLGKWLTQDPLGLKAGPNLYAYCINNPMTHLDLYGLLDQENKSDRSVSDRLRDILSDTGRGIRNFLYATIEKVIQHGPRIGRHSDRAVDRLREARGAPPINRAKAGTYKVFDGSPTSTNCVAIGHPNGLGCNYEDALKNAEALKNQFNGNHPDIYVVYSPTHGILTDLAYAFANMFGYETSNVGAQVDGMKELAAKAIEGGPGAYSLLVPHSNGGQTSYLASQHLEKPARNKIYIESIASTKIFHIGQGYIEARNHAGWSDFVPTIADPIGVAYRGILRQGDLQMVGRPIRLPFSQHAFTGKEYRPILKDIAKRHGR